MDIKITGIDKLQKDLDKAVKKVEIHCINCGRKYKVDLTKKKAKCPKCKTEMKIN